MATMLNIQMSDTPYTGNMYSHFLLLLKLDNRQELLSIHQEVMPLSECWCKSFKYNAGLHQVGPNETSMNYLKSSSSLIHLLQCQVKTEDFP